MNPFAECARIEKKDLNIAQCDMLDRTNIIAYVPIEKHEVTLENTQHKAVVFDAKLDQVIMEWEFKSKVLGVRLRRDKVVIILEREIYIYGITGIEFGKLIYRCSTFNNPWGLCELSPVSSDKAIMVWPGHLRGSIQIMNLCGLSPKHSKSPQTISAHQDYLHCIAISESGNLIATTSDAGTNIKIWDSVKGVKLAELHRGSSRTFMYSIAFDRTGKWLACYSSSGTCHLFNVEAAKTTQSSMFSLSSKWSSIAKVTVHSSPPKKGIVGFTADSEVYLCYVDGIYEHYRTQLNASNLVLRNRRSFWKPVIGEDF